MQKEVYEHISRKTNDPIIERRKCKVSGENFPIYESEKKILEDISPTINGKKYNIQLPNLSPNARQILRMLYRNDRIFYKNKSDHSGKGIISIYPQKYAGKVYEVNERYKDFWNPMDYGKDYTGSENIRNTIKEMMLEVPRLNVDGVGNTNSDYCNYCGYCKDCYMDIAGENNENCYHCLFTKYSKRCLDCTFVYNSEYCYETISSYGCNKIIYSQYLENSHNCFFSFDLKNCHNCLRCRNLRNKDYYILNKKVSKEKFEETIKQIINGTYSSYKEGIKKYNEIKQNFIYPEAFKINAERSYGNNIKDIKNSKFIFNVSEVEDSLYLYDVLHAKNCLDLNYSLYNPEFSYQLISTLELKKSICNFATHHSNYVYYSQLCNNSNHLFGCIGLNNKEYCIFNKQYTKDKYFEKLEDIIENMIKNNQWGEFFPPYLSPHPYNDTIAQEYYPADKIGKLDILNPDKFISEAILDMGGEKKMHIKRRTKNQEVNIPQGINLLNNNDISDNIENIDNSIIQKAIFDMENKRPFRIVKPELDFYKKMNLPIPRLHPEIRNLNRINIRPKRKLYLRNCDKNGEKIITTHSPNSGYKVYSESCYNKEIYG